MLRPRLGTSTVIHSNIMLCVGALTSGAAWLTCSRLAGAASKQDMTISSLDEPARTMLATPALAALPGALVVLLAVVALLTPRLRSPALFLAGLLVLAAIGLVVATFVQFLAPMYEFRPI